MTDRTHGTRALRIAVFHAAGALPAIVAAAVVPASACQGVSDDTGTTGPGGASGDAAAGTGAGGGAAAAGGTADGPGGTGGVVWFDVETDVSKTPCRNNSPDKFTYTVEVPPPGTPADPGSICAVDAGTVGSNKAARVTLSKYSPSVETAQGFVAIAAPLEPLVAGLPTIEVVQASYPGLELMQVANVDKIAGGFSFHASWPNKMPLDPPTAATGMWIRTRFPIACGDGGTRLVESLTRVDLCIGVDVVEWMSSGDQCTALCKVVPEMAPTPIVPAPANDDLPLSRVIRLSLRRIVTTVGALPRRDGAASKIFAQSRATANRRRVPRRTSIPFSNGWGGNRQRGV